MIVKTGESQQTPTSGRYQEDLALVIVKLGVSSRRSQGKGPTYPFALKLCSNLWQNSAQFSPRLLQNSSQTLPKNCLTPPEFQLCADSRESSFESAHTLEFALYSLSPSLSLSPNLHSASNFYLNLVLCSLSLFLLGFFRT